MERETQLSAFVSRSTRDLLEHHVRATGMKKGRVIEDALRHHLQAIESLPRDVIIHPRLVITRRSGDAVLRRMASGKPTGALRRLLRDGD